jgi:Tfp pilus assembly PilM family ATPase
MRGTVRFISFLRSCVKRNRRLHLGIDISNEKIRIAGARASRGGRKQLTEHWEVPLPPDCVIDGNIADELQVTYLLSWLVENCRLRHAKAQIAVSGYNVLFRKLRLPDVSRNKLRKLIDFEIQHMKLLPFESPYYDFAVLPKTSPPVTQTPSDTDEQMRDVIVAAAKPETVEPIVRVLTNAGLVPVSLESRSAAIYRLIEAIARPGEERPFMAVDIEPNAAHLGIFYQGQLMAEHHAITDFTSSFPFDGRGELDRNISHLMNYFYYGLNCRDQPLEHIYLSGSAAGLEEIAGYLRGRFGQNVELLYDEHLAVGARLEEGQFYAYAAAIGTALREGER